MMCSTVHNALTYFLRQVLDGAEGAPPLQWGGVWSQQRLFRNHTDLTSDL